MTRSTSDASVRTTALSLKIIDALQSEDGMQLTEVAERFDIGRSTAHRHLQTLVHHGYVVKANRSYELGLAFLDPGVYARDNHTLYKAGAQYIDRLANQTGEQVWLITRQNAYSIVLYRETGNNTLKSSERLGQRRLLHQSAAGKAMLAALPTSEVRSLIREHGLPAITENTITEESDLLAELQQIRNRGGIAFNYEETSVGLRAVSALIINDESQVLGAISVSGPVSRLQGPVLDQDLPQQLLSVANEIQVNLRYS